MSNLIEAYQYGSLLHRLHENWTPHPGQVPIGRSLFYENCKNIFVQCGRNWGKTEFAKYAAVRWALTHPGSENYIFEPFQKQAREILWESGRLWDGLPKDWIDGKPNDTELRLTFTNGSFIKLDGTDNREAIAGYKPRGLIVYDEFKDHDKRAVDIFEPNRAAFNVPALFIGTPPSVVNHFVELGNFAKTSKRWRYFHGPTSQNPHISKEWLDEKKEELIARGELETWLREYEAIFVIGGKNSVFPGYGKIIKENLSALLPKDINNWELVVSFDPGSTSVFAVCFILHNRFTKQIIVADEIYETKMSDMTTRKIYERTKEKLEFFKKLNLKDINYVFDSAAQWFRNEMSEISDFWLTPCDKVKVQKEDGISIVRDIIAKNLMAVSNQCEKFDYEMSNYVKDENGKIPKDNDHLIDSLRYALTYLDYQLNEAKPPDPVDQDMQARFFKPQDDLFDGVREQSYRDFDEEL